ncbi:MAG: strawberry notch family protein [Acidobacteria bacterium]|nr:strawberry notch family protein [Acidobacteriota bacterium]MCW5949446.1 strawberry notch family protein [Pyrinomonadaceae bacterium]HMT09160.1 strawberry notch family protein [Pyrinomonadaceae bacterium]
MYTAIQERSSEELSVPIIASSETPFAVEHTESDADLQVYSPRYISGGSPHPGVIVEPPGLANVEPPPIRYRPHLPKCLSETGKLSAMQVERIVYAGQAHEQRLADGARAGISIGDGTGTGKTATLAGIILDNWFQGRMRAVWFSVKTDLMEAVSDEFKRLGLTPPIKLINDFPTDQEIDIQDGIVFCTYRSLIARNKKGNKRIDQITRWLGPNGIVIFDEGHKAKYAFADDRGKSTQTGAAVLEIQNPEKFPDVRVVYSSATSAGEVRHLAYMSRLGLWGEGTNFPLGFEQFAEEIESGGVGALEMVCRDLKSMGRYLCGNLSMGTDPESGLAVEFREVTHWLTPAQRTMYDNMAQGWQEVFRNIHRALDLTNSGKATRSQAVNQFWAEHQRCFRNLITAFKVPTLIREIEGALSRRESIVVSITGTGESQTKKQIERAADEDEAIDSLDFSPRETLTRLVANCFPTACFQERSNPYNGTIEYIPLVDANGAQVESRAALQLRAELLDKLSVLEVPEHPLDQLVNYFGVENVAEMTGRKKRLIRTANGTLEYRPRQLPGVPSKLINLYEKNAFQNGDKRIAIMSEVASTGDSLHAGCNVGNKQRRLHIAAELKWSADKQIQDFGRTHRTGQVAPPVYLLVFTELGGEKRFSATIARRLGNMGALTKGDRRAEKAGNLDKYNLESREGRSALNVVLTGIMRGREIDGLDDAMQALRDMGLVKTVDGEEKVPDSEKTNIPRFLNRLLSLEVERQNALFDHFYATFLETIEYLKQKGKLDDGMEDLKALSVALSTAPQILNSDPLTGAKTVYYKLELKVATTPAKYNEMAASEVHQFFQERRDGSFIAVRRTLSHTDPETGERYQMFSITKPVGRNVAYVRESELNQRYRVVPKTKAETWWLNEENRIPAFENRTVHLLSGALLPLWKYLKTLSHDALNIVRTTTDDGTRLVGVKISEEWLRDIRQHFGLRFSIPTTANEVLRVVDFEKNSVNLIRDITVRSARFQGQLLTEICPSTFEQIRELRGMGLVNIVQHGKQRFFLPQESPWLALERVLFLFPPVSTSISFLPELQAATEELAKPEPINLPEWLIEPALEFVNSFGASTKVFADQKGIPLLNKTFAM